MNPCDTCNASHKNTVERIIRCMGCKHRYDGQPPTNWRPIKDQPGGMPTKYKPAQSNGDKK